MLNVQRELRRRCLFATRWAVIGLPITFAPVFAQTPSFQPTYEENTARRGQDYRSFHPMAPSALYCQQACLTEGQCRAWSYDGAGVSGDKQPTCWLKSGVPEAADAQGLFSGVVRPDSNFMAANPPNRTTNAPAQRGSVQAIFENYNLLGDFAQDCNKPPSAQNFHYVSTATDADHIQRERMKATNSRDYVNVIDKVSGLGPNEISVGGTRTEGNFQGQAFQEIWRIEPNRYIVVEATVGNTKLVSDGRLNNGQAAWWINKCSPTPTGTPVANAGAPPPAHDGAVKAVFEKYNMLGVWAADCSKPAKAIDNWYYVNRLVDANHVRRELMGSPTAVTSVTIIDKAWELRPNEIAGSGTREGKPTTGVWRLDSGRMLQLSATFGDQQLIADGKWVKTGADMPWMSRCD
jgi:PAN domain